MGDMNEQRPGTRYESENASGSKDTSSSCRGLNHWDLGQFSARKSHTFIHFHRQKSRFSQKQSPNDTYIYIDLLDMGVFLHI